MDLQKYNLFSIEPESLKQLYYAEISIINVPLDQTAGLSYVRP